MNEIDDIMDRESIAEQRRLIAECDRLNKIIVDRDKEIRGLKDYISKVLKADRKVKALANYLKETMP